MEQNVDSSVKFEVRMGVLKFKYANPKMNCVKKVCVFVRLCITSQQRVIFVV